jgi:tRNA pseudouridine38-40 synthase
MNVLLTISYDGTNYCGWQRQINGISVQQKTEEALCSILKTQLTVIGASRTDAGVHALGQRVMFSIDDLRIPLDKLPYALNAKLPADIITTKAEQAPDGFHPIFNAKRKTYEYTIYTGNFMNPLLINRCCFVNHPLDTSEMRKAAAHFLGEHDFSSFKASGGSAKTSVRTVHSLDVTEKGGLITVSICGNGFLYNMVRIIAGTLIYVGEGKIKSNGIPGIINSRRREFAGKTAPPQGLTLISIEY